MAIWLNIWRAQWRPFECRGGQWRSCRILRRPEPSLLKNRAANAPSLLRIPRQLVALCWIKAVANDVPTFEANGTPEAIGAPIYTLAATNAATNSAPAENWAANVTPVENWAANVTPVENWAANGAPVYTWAAITPLLSMYLCRHWCPC